MIDDLGLLTARATVGLSIAAHGAQKAFGWFEGPGLSGAAGFFESLGFKPGEQHATAASYTEIGSGVALTLGLGGPLAPAAILSVMTVAQQAVHAKNGFFAQKGGVELGVLYGAAAVALASSGYGALSLDRALGLEDKLRNPVFTTLALLGGVIAGQYVLGRRDFSPPEGTLAQPTFSQRGNGQAAPAPSAN